MTIRPPGLDKAGDRSNSLKGNRVGHGGQLIGLCEFTIKRKTGNRQFRRLYL